MKKINFNLFVILMAMILSAPLMSCGGDDDTTENENGETAGTDPSESIAGQLQGYWYTNDYRETNYDGKRYYACACMNFKSGNKVVIYDLLVSSLTDSDYAESWLEDFSARPGWYYYDYSASDFYNNKSYSFSVSGNKITISCGRILTLNNNALTLFNPNEDWIKSSYTKKDFSK